MENSAVFSIIEPYQRPALTPRGTAAAHLSRFQDAWAELTAEDRAWFASWLNELLIDAVVPETACVPSAPEKRGTPGRR